MRYQNVYHGVDLVYHGNQGQLEYDFVVAPGVDPAAIALDVASASSRQAAKMAALRIAATGDLVMAFNGGEIRFHKPVVYQNVGAGLVPARKGRPQGAPLRRYLDGHYVLSAHNRVGFAVSSYDRSQPLVIDPVLTYSSLLGGSADDFGNGIAVDGSSNAYLTGKTASTGFPRVNQIPGACQGICAGPAFVTKLNAAGNALVYSSLIGGSTGDYGEGIAVDGSGNAYLTGYTYSSDFPRVNQIPGACKGTCGSGNNQVVFVTKVNAAGNALAYSSLIGGSRGDSGTGIAVDGSGNAYLTGITDSTDFPRVNQIPGACRGLCGTADSAFDDFVAKINTAGSALLYSSYLGGSDVDEGLGIAVDGSGNAYLTGQTKSTDFPIVHQIPGACNGSCGSGALPVAFVTKVNAAGSALAYSSYLGGSGNNQEEGDSGDGIAVDGSDNAYLTGGTFSTDFPRVDQISGACNGTCGSGRYEDAFVTKINAAGYGLVYSSYVGGSLYSQGNGIAVDALGNAYLTGFTGSSDFPRMNQIPGACNGTCGNGSVTNAFVTKINGAGSALIYSSYLGGSGGPYGYGDSGQGIAVDGSGNAYLTGQTASIDFPRVNQIPDACQGTCGSGISRDVFVTKVSSTGTPIASLSPTSLTFGPQGVSAPNVPQTVTLTNTGVLPLSITSIAVTGQNRGDFLEADNCPRSPNTLASGDSCRMTVVFAPTGAGTLKADLTLTDNAPDSPQNVPLTGMGIGGKPGLAGPQGARQTAQPSRH